MLEEACGFSAKPSARKKRRLARLPAAAALEKRNRFVEHERVAVDFDILSDRISQPSTIVGYAGPNALAGCGSHQCCTSPSANWRAAARSRCSRVRSGPRSGERHAILQLIAKAVGAAGLIEGRARPNAAGERLVEQPAIEHEVHRAVGRLDLDCAQNLAPMVARCRACTASRSAARYGADRGAGVLDALRPAQQKDTTSTMLARPQFRAWSAAPRKDPGPRRPLLDSGAVPRQRRRVRERAVAADEFAPVARPIGRVAPPMSAKATREPNVRFQGLRANIAPVFASISVFDKGQQSRSRCAPSTHST